MPDLWPALPRWEWIEATHAQEFPGLVHLDATMGAAAGTLAGRAAYLATPYTAYARAADGGFDARGGERAARLSAMWLAEALEAGVAAHCPVIASHVAVVQGACVLDPLDGAAWESLNAPVLAACAGVVVPPIDRWRGSAGIWREVGATLRWQRPVFVIGEGWG
ncbi:MAG: DUF1937 family protein [Rhodobacteraceae bacterium]|nr:DUF1937 family protein [Paracoccaceae bacterium]MBC7157378.1 DUF1937 family protein [Paracoccaceae bacterium]